MDAERFARVRALYDAVVDLAPSLRADALAAQGTPADLATEVLALCLASDNDRTGALDRPRDVLLGEATAPAPAVGDVFGVWRVIAEIGHGGMGRVYRVERSDGHYTQTAALKFIRGVAGESAIALFSRERQLLAQLSHPRIARLIDGGSAAHGQPYLVMDYVDGVPIDRWCAQHRPRREPLLDLFVAACSAVSHAHRQLVVHCDLKPSNILVTRDGEPVLLDFGIARMTDRLAEQAGIEQAGGGSAGYTPRYASPEQRRGEQVGTPSDVYSLGIVLGDMLASAGLRSEGELAAVISMATREHPDERYASVDALCEDLVRLRHHRPLKALPATPRYRLAKFLRRRWLATAVTASVLLLCSAFIVIVIGERQRALAAEQRALAERDRAREAEAQARAAEVAARETSSFLISVFRGGNPDAGSGTVSLATVLDTALSRVERDLAGTPATQAPLMATLAKVLFVIGQPDRGQQLFTRAIALERGQQRPLVLADMLLSHAYELRRDRIWQIDHDAVLEAVHLVEAHAAAGSTLHLELLLNAASTLGAGGRPEADALFERVLQEAREHHPDSVALANALGAYGWHRRRHQDHPRAIALMRESLELRRRLLGDAHIEYVTQLEALAGTLQQARRLTEAEPLFREALDLHRRQGRLASRQGAWALIQYAALLGSAGRASEAFPFFDEAFSIGRQKFPEDSGAFSVWTHNLAHTVAETGDLPRATALVEDAIATIRTQGPAAHRRLARSLVLKARILRQSGCNDGAGAAVDDALQVLATLPSPDPLALGDAQLVRAQWLLDCRRLAEAGTLLATLSTPQAASGPGGSLQIAHAAALLALWRDGDGPAYASLIEAEQALAADFATGHPQAALVRLPRAEWLHAQRRHSEASTLATAMLGEIGDRLVAHAALRRRLAVLRETD